MTDRPHRRDFSVVPRTIVPGEPRPDLAADGQRTREAAVAQHAEIDLLVAALREHVADLRLERNRLIEENQRLADELHELQQRDAAAGEQWLISRQKTQR